MDKDPNILNEVVKSTFEVDNNPFTAAALSMTKSSVNLIKAFILYFIQIGVLRFKKDRCRLYKDTFDKLDSNLKEIVLGMLDCCRNFYPVEFIFKILDAIALHKINRFHWHLTDDQGWRIPIKEYPLLTEVGAWRNDCRYTWVEKVGGFYTEDEIKAVVKKASELHITVVPEIETPGHSSSVLAAYSSIFFVSNAEKSISFTPIKCIPRA